MKIESASVVIVLACAVATCGPEGGSTARVWAEHDSAGVTIVTNRVGDLGNGGWSVGPETILSIGGLEAPEEGQLFQVSGATRLPDGRVAIGSAGTFDVRIFGPDGTLLSRYGTEGDGPGEFRDVNLLGRYGPDTLVVFDASLSRITLVGSDKGFLGSEAVRWEGKGYPVARGLGSDGRILMGGGMSFSSSQGFPTGVIRPLSTFGWVARDGATLGSLGDHPAAEMFARAGTDGFMARRLPFSRRTVATPAKGGAWLGTGDRWEVGLYDLQGELVRVVRTDAPARGVTPALRKAYEAEAVSQATTENQARQIRELLAEMPFPADVPPFEELVTDALGFLWVQEYAAPVQDTPLWIVFDPDGHAVARLATPPKTRLLEIGQDYVLGRSLDELDVESVRMWPLRRGTP